MVRVECTAPVGQGSIEPTALWFGTRRVDVRAVADRWYGTEQRWWKVETPEGFYIVRRHEVNGTWDLAAVVGGGCAPGTTTRSQRPAPG